MKRYSDKPVPCPACNVEPSPCFLCMDHRYVSPERATVYQHVVRLDTPGHDHPPLERLDDVSLDDQE